MASDKVNYPEAGSIAQAIKYQIRTGTRWDDRTPAEKESIDQIATALARMVVGDGAHWDAIIGYAHAAKPGTADMPLAEPPRKPVIDYFGPQEPRAARAGIEAVERTMRDIPNKADFTHER